MSLLDRVRTCQSWVPENYRPLIVAGREMGKVGQAFARCLADYPAVLEVTDRAVRLSDRLQTFEDRTDALHEVLVKLRAAGEIRIWRDEPYPLRRQWHEPALMTVERGCAGLLGIRAYGVHLNGLVADEAGLKIWVAKRALTKPTAPGKLDHLVAGGQPYGIPIFDNLIKECAEEAAIPPDLARQAQPTGLLSYICEQPDGLRDDICFVYDLMLPAAFNPENRDGEVAGFYLWPIEKAAAVIAESEDFKFNCALVVIDLLARRGILMPDDPDYHDILHGLRLKD